MRGRDKYEIVYTYFLHTHNSFIHFDVHVDCESVAVQMDWRGAKETRQENVNE